MKTLAILMVCGFVCSAQAQLKLEHQPKKPWETDSRRFNVQVNLTFDLEPKKPEDKFYSYAVTFGCRSDHNTGDKPNRFNEVNPCLGITKFFDTKILGGTPYLSARYVFENSRDGKMRAFGPGMEWCPFSGPYVDGCVGLSYVRVDYEDAWRARSAHGKFKVPHFALKRGPNAIQVESLGKKDIAIALRHSF